MLLPMKILYTLLICSFLSSLSVRAQNCNDCTTTISTVVNNDVMVGQGEKLCITTTGVINGKLEVSDWGLVCNEGNITGEILISQGILNNYGMVDSDKDFFIGEGNLSNYGSMNVAEMYFNGKDIFLRNYGPIIADNIQSNDLSVSSLNFKNHDSIGVGNCFLDVAWLENFGVITTTGQFQYASVYGEFYNYHGIRVGSDFINKGSFYTECMIYVGGNWTNHSSGTIAGISPGCGGFTVMEHTSNYGDLGFFEAIDICDSTNIGSLNINNGSTYQVSYCSCDNACPISVPISVGEVESVASLNVYPNPSKYSMMVQSSGEPLGEIIVYDVLGNLIVRQSTDNAEIKLDISSYTSGVYLLKTDQGIVKLLKQ